MTTEAKTQGIHHVGLTVPDIHETRAFFVDVLGFNQVGEKPDYPAVFVSDGHIMLTLWQVQEREAMVPFDRKRCVGLHHLALRIPSQAALDALHQTLTTTEDVEIEFAPEPLGATGVRHMMCLIPGGIRIEFLAVG